MPPPNDFHHVVMSQKDYDEYVAWKNRPRCPNEGQMCNCTGACQPKPPGLGAIQGGLKWDANGSTTPTPAKNAGQ